jgi:hypothetical protein
LYASLVTVVAHSIVTRTRNQNTGKVPAEEAAKAGFANGLRSTFCTARSAS